VKRRIEVGVLFSRSGAYALIGAACHAGALQAIEEVNADPDLGIELRAVERDPQGNVDAYAPLCEEILRGSSARHVIGCVTSWSRKEVIPTLERANGSLWYPVPYEGFEASDRVVYTHACPNQHLLPLLAWTFRKFGRRGYLTGSNYIWGWEMNRLARDVITGAGGEVLGERYLPIGSTDIGRMIEEVRETRPDFVLNQLIGPSQYAFLAAYRALGEADPHFRAERCPVLSCNLTECELPAIGDGAADGLVAAGPWFRGAQGGADFGSSHQAAAHAAVWMLARLLDGEAGSEALPLARLLERPLARRLGIDPATHHVTLPALIAQVRGGSFRVIEDCGRVPGDPWLARGREVAVPRLRAVP
jgi:ABC-type branched-subunit amino acid transport system substrate-binding protein